jgi:hypothetical protein
VRKAAVDSIIALQDAQGRLTAQRLVEVARNKRHPCHDLFDWDNDSAAHAHRLDQARTLIKMVTVKINVHRVEMRIVGFVRDPTCVGGQQGYISIGALRSDVDQARVALDREFEAVAARLERARAVAAGLGLSAEFDDRLDQLVFPRPRLVAAE